MDICMDTTDPRKTASIHGIKNIPVDERLLPFRGNCPFTSTCPKIQQNMALQFGQPVMPNPAKQIYTGKPPSGAPGRDQGMMVVLQMSEGLQGHCIT
ncbi:Tryptophan 2,3-dioxygenase [Labeo rohita]|uniref:Tryptophan 2,3-dioxygenase n=1 Tax=Labeo rohita TaxID=84645 RepID=A0ABQ8LA95_LABRO|nr:Tryptophan 2,3-dioxygenase [Labeo rohita]